MQIAYFINQYPKVSHTFIRREIQALERQGFEVQRIALRGWDAELVDASDRAERDKTQYVLQQGLAGLLQPLLGMTLRHPLRMLRAARFAGQLWFAVAPETLEAMTRLRASIRIVSP